ncbi:MAG: class I SAM-dependent methyltransferase [Deltaproteobacteria bacterium]|nr:class I SAM-dependent methyltransferase [Deltaproteobacteria bacterium]
MTFIEALRGAAHASGTELPEPVLEACAAHYAMLCAWNQTHNLTRIVDPADAARRHYLDCLLPLLAWPAPASFVDVGSGAGFPGLMAALAWPTSHGVLIEPARKRASFLALAAAEIGVQRRIEVVGAGTGQHKAERVLSRATFSAGKRYQLAPMAASPGEVGLWGLPHEVTTWEAEAATWGFSGLAPLHYRVSGLEERCVLRASRPKLGDVSRGTSRDDQ